MLLYNIVHSNLDAGQCNCIFGDTKISNAMHLSPKTFSDRNLKYFLSPLYTHLFQ